MNRIVISRACALAAAGMFSVSALGQSSGGQQSGSDQRSGSGQQQQQQQQKQAGHQQGAQSDQAPEGFILIEERVVMLTANEPQNHFLRAAQYAQQNDARAAAGEVRIAAAYLDMQASRVKGGGGGKQELTTAADQLRQVADQLQKPQQQQGGGQQGQSGQGQGQAQGQGQGQQQQQLARQLTKAFANANHALARHFHAQAERGIQGRKAIMAGHDLDAAASALQAAVAWSGQQPPQDVVSAVQGARRTSMQLLSPDGQAQSGGAAGGQAQASGGSGGGLQSTDQAQPAGARLGSSSEQGQGQAQQSGGRIPEDASKAVDQLGSAIRQVGTQFQGGGQSGQQGGGDGQSDTNKGGSGASK